MYVVVKSFEEISQKKKKNSGFFAKVFFAEGFMSTLDCFRTTSLKTLSIVLEALLLNLTLTLTFNLIYIVFHNNVYHYFNGFIFTVYLGLIFYDGEMSVKLYVKMTLIF